VLLEDTSGTVPKVHEYACEMTAQEPEMGEESAGHVLSQAQVIEAVCYHPGKLMMLPVMLPCN
jgi:hypothetical protein